MPEIQITATPDDPMEISIDGRVLADGDAFPTARVGDHKVLLMKYALAAAPALDEARDEARMAEFVKLAAAQITRVSQESFEAGVRQERARQRPAAIARSEKLRQIVRDPATNLITHIVDLE